MARDREGLMYGVRIIQESLLDLSTQAVSRSRHLCVPLVTTITPYSKRKLLRRNTPKHYPPTQSIEAKCLVKVHLTKPGAGQSL